jgi:hypothetical protein
VHRDFGLRVRTREVFHVLLDLIEVKVSFVWGKLLLDWARIIGPSQPAIDGPGP